MLGMVIMLILFIAMCLIALSIAKILLTYLFSMLGIAFLVLLFPVMISLMLFKSLGQVMNNYIKYFVVMVVYQIMGAVGVTLISLLIIYTTGQVFSNYAICKGCLMSIGGWCPFDAWYPLAKTHVPDSGGLGLMFIPNGLFGSAIFLALLGLLAYEFSDLCFAIANRLVLFQEGRQNSNIAMLAGNMLGSVTAFGLRQSRTAMSLPSAFLQPLNNMIEKSNNHARDNAARAAQANAAAALGAAAQANAAPVVGPVGGGGGGGGQGPGGGPGRAGGAGGQGPAVGQGIGAQLPQAQAQVQQQQQVPQQVQQPGQVQGGQPPAQPVPQQQAAQPPVPQQQAAQQANRGGGVNNQGDGGGQNRGGVGN
jgi:hypothetical protein